LKNIFLNLQHGWNSLAIAIGMLLITEAVLYPFKHFHIFESQNEEPLSLLEGAPTPESYLETNWYEGYVKECLEAIPNISWKPYVYWSTHAYKGKYLNIDERSIRKTWSPNRIGKTQKFKIFVFGGSTMWGWGARDDFTIPSIINKILFNEYGVDAEIINFGEVGYVSTQELIRFMMEIQNNNIPDLVIFYDGLNEIFSALRAGQVGQAGVSWGELDRKTAFHQEKLSVLQRIATSYAAYSPVYYYISKILRKNEPNETKNLDENQQQKIATDIYQIYLQNLNIIRSISKFYGFKTLFYWQPIILTKDDYTPYESHIASVGESYFHGKSIFVQLRKLISNIKENDFHDLSEILSGYQRPFYIDYFHIDELGNEILGRKIANDVLEIVKKSNRSNL